jgi:hypothetical protein
MRTNLTTACAAITLAAALILAPAARASGPTAPPRAPRAAVVEPHPEINRAILALEAAKVHLRRAAHDFGGHRVAAIAAIDRALNQLRLALQFDKD